MTESGDAPAGGEHSGPEDHPGSVPQVASAAAVAAAPGGPAGEGAGAPVSTGARSGCTPAAASADRDPEATPPPAAVTAAAAEVAAGAAAPPAVSREAVDATPAVAAVSSAPGDASVGAAVAASRSTPAAAAVPSPSAPGVAPRSPGEATAPASRRTPPEATAAPTRSLPGVTRSGDGEGTIPTSRSPQGEAPAVPPRSLPGVTRGGAGDAAVTVPMMRGTASSARSGAFDPPAAGPAGRGLAEEGAFAPSPMSGSALDAQAATYPSAQSPSRSAFHRDLVRDPRKRDALAQRETLPIARPPDTDDTIPDRPDLSDQTSEMPLGALLGSDGSTETSGWGSLLLRRRSSFFRQVFFWLLGMSLLMSIGSGAIYYSRQLSFIEKDRTQRAHLLLGYLATQSQLGAYAGDRSLLSHPVRRMADEEDVVFVAVYDARGRELIKTSARSGRPPPEPPPGLLQTVLSEGGHENDSVRDPSRDLFEQGISRRVWSSQNESFNCTDLYAAIVISERGAPGVAAYVHPSDRLTDGARVLPTNP